MCVHLKYLHVYSCISQFVHYRSAGDLLTIQMVGEEGSGLGRQMDTQYNDIHKCTLVLKQKCTSY